MTDRAQTASRANSVSGLSADTPSFESQLSSALTESLEKLGVGSGEVNISIRNATPSTRQIVVTYSVEGAGGTPAPAPSTPTAPAPAATTPTATTPTATTPPTPAAPALSPFTMDLPYIAPKPTIEQSSTAWAPHSGPVDSRDQLPEGGGKLTGTGAPLIQDNAKAAGNQFKYTGPAAKNPYFSTPSNPLRQGYVLGFEKWFETPLILGGPTPQAANKTQYSTEEGATEALRIVEQFSPEAKIVKSTWQSGPYAVDKEMYEIELGEGRRLNAGGVLCAYYTHGYGVPASSDETIRAAIQLA